MLELLEHAHEGRRFADLGLNILVHLDTGIAVIFDHGRLDLFRQPTCVPAVAPGQQPGRLCRIGVVRIVGKGASVGLRVRIVRPPSPQIHVQLARPVARQDLLGGAHGDVDLDARLRCRVLETLTDLDPLLGLAHANFHLEVLDTRSGQKLLGLFNVVGEGVFL